MAYGNQSPIPKEDKLEVTQNQSTCGSELRTRPLRVGKELK